MEITKKIATNTELSAEQLIEGEYEGKYIAVLYQFDSTAGAWNIIGDTYDNPTDTPEEAIERGMDTFKRFVRPDYDDEGQLLATGHA